jgi:hypothetical protein
MIRDYQRWYRRHAWLATAFVALGAPYVLATNTTASAGVIVIHVLTLWLVVPPLAAAADLIVERRRGADAAGPRPGWATVTLRIAAQWAALAVAVAAMLAVVHAGTGIPWQALVVRPLATAIVPLYSWYALAVVLDALRRQRESALRLELAHAQAAWAALAAQIQPHFLFNSLASLEELIAVDAARARELVRRLGSLYRAVLRGAERRFWPLADELAVVRDYLHVQAVRFGERLRVTIEADPMASARHLPATLVLTLVENAVKHGIEPLPAGGTIAVSARLDGRRLVVEVASPPVPADALAPAAAASAAAGASGYGHRDVLERLRLAYGSATSFRLTAEPDRTLARLELPEAPA